jgi:AcrR family transcriptional regulator
MRRQEQREKHKEEFRREIIAAARELFTREGYEKFSMRKLARHIGYSPTTIYLYFRDKDDLLFTISEQFYADLYRVLAGLRTQQAEPIEILRSALFNYVETGLANPGHYKAAFFTSPHIYGSPSDYLENDTMSRRMYFLSRQIVADSIAAGALKNMDLDILTQVLWAGVHGIVSAAIFTADFPLVDSAVLVETMVDGLLDGLKG